MADTLLERRLESPSEPPLAMPRQSPHLSGDDIIRWLTAFAITLVVGVTLIGNQIVAQGNDAVFSQSLVNRALRFGGSYYDNGISPKGPLEDVAHDIARRIGGYDGSFYVISIMVAISAAILGLAAARTALATGGNRAMAFAVAVVVYIHFTLGGTAYSGLLYSRNILVTLLAGAWMLVLADRAWTGSRPAQTLAAVATGVLLGLAVQTIIPAVVDAASIGAAALILLARRVPDRARRTRLRWTVVAGAAIGFASAPVWYLVTGNFRSFWASWWTYADYQNSGIGLSLGEQLSKGWHVAYSYYQHRPLLFLVIALFVGYTLVAWQEFEHKTRVVHITLLGWLLGGWFQLVTGERYSAHYFVVVAAPSAMIVAAFAGHACAPLLHWPKLRRTVSAWPLLALVLAFFLSAETAHRLIDASSLTSGFTSVRRGAELTRANQSPTHRSIQAVLDLVSRDQDPLLVYDDNQFIYRDYRRIPATRFQQRYFLVGSIYLGQTSKKYILAGSSRWFEDDMRQANPAAFLRTRAVDSPIVSQWVQGHFEIAFRGKDGIIWLRNDVADSVLRTPISAPWMPPAMPAPDQGWTVTADSAAFVKGTREMANDRITLAASACTSISGTAVARSDVSGVVFHFVDPTGHAAEAAIALDGAQASSRDANGAVLENRPTRATDVKSVPFSVVIGLRAAALVVGGRIVSAVDIPQHAMLTAEAMRSGLTLAHLQVGPSSVGSGCPA